MFTKPFSVIEFDDIVAFWEEWPEGVRVEYKQEIPNTIPKLDFVQNYRGNKVKLVGKAIAFD